MSKKFYAVKVGKKPGIYLTWDECKEQVDRYSGAIYKSFKTIEEAESFVGKKTKNISKGLKSVNKTKLKNKQDELTPIKSKANVDYFENYIEPDEIKDKFELVVFVDGSYDKQSKIFGSGIAVLDNKEEYSKEYKYAGYDKWDQWNIVGEIEAAKYAIKLAYEKKLKSVCIYHDLKNISLWAAGTWKAKNEYTQSYVRFIEKYSKELKITFIKVKGHSCNRYNDLADRLAREAIKEYLA